MIIDLYHGSVDIIEKPIYGAGKPANDYGRGFYCTENIELAKEWACGSKRDGYANHYKLETEGLTMLNLNSEDFTVLNWLAVLTKHRTYWQNNSISAEAKKYLQDNFYVDTTNYDLVRGYRADDSYFSFAQNFVSGAISYRKLAKAMKLGKLGEQIMLQSPKAFETIHFINAEKAEAELYFDLKDERDKAVRKEFRRQSNDQDTADDIYMIDIMREGIKNDDPRLR